MPESYTFNLADEPWLPCLRADGALVTLSLRDLLLQAHQIQDLVPDSPTQYPPLLRLILAVVHRAVGTDDHPGPRTEEEWRALWKMDRLPADRITRYLDRFRDRFDLFHDETPFAQAAGLRARSGETKTIGLLIPYVAAGNNVPLFSAARDADPPPLSPAEAARWLVHAHAWDTAAIKTGAEDDPQVKNGKTTGNPTGPLGQLGVLIPTGPTLRHTLLCNLRILTSQISGSGDAPLWERPPLGPQWRERTPAGLLDLYTWPSRRIRLIPEPADDGVRVRRVVLCAGDRLRLHELYGIEPHCAWRRSRPQEKKLGRGVVYMPVTHRPGRQLWRGLGPVLAREALTGIDGPNSKVPAMLEQLADHADTLEELAGVPLRLRGIGMTYGNQSAIIDETYSDVLPLPVALLGAQESVWEPVVLDAVRAAEAVARHLAALASNLAKAAGCDDDRLLDARRDQASTRLYADLDHPFRQWLARIDDLTPRAARDEWRDTVRKSALQIADDLIGRVSPRAVRGRTVETSPNKTPRLTSALAEIWFRAALKKELPPDNPEEMQG